MNANTNAATVEDANVDTAKAVEAMQNLKREVYLPSQLDAGQEAASKAIETVEAAGGSVLLSFDADSEFPENYALAIIPTKQRDDAAKKTVVIGVTIGAVPTQEAIALVEGGSSWIASAILDANVAKLANAARSKSDANGPVSLPFSVMDFISNNRPDGVLVAYRQLAPVVIKSLKDKGLTMITEPLLRQVLQSKAFAEQTFPTIDWDIILDKMIKTAIANDLAPGMLQEWKNTRATAGLPDLSDFDASGLEFELD